MTELPVHYRLRDLATGPGVEIIVEKFFPIAETPKGYWVLGEYDVGSSNPEYIKLQRRWVPKESPRFCSPTLAAAAYSFERRKAVQLRKLKWQLEQVEQALAGLKTLGAEPFPSKGLDCGTPVNWTGLTWD